MRKRKTGPARMNELGRKKIEVWLSEAQMKAFAKLADELKLPRATLARRALNYAVGGGPQAMRVLVNCMLD